MNVLSVSRRFAKKLAAQVDLLWQEIVAAAARLLPPKGVLIPVRVVVDRKTTARRND
jgi:hypothetical protein